MGKNIKKWENSEINKANSNKESEKNIFPKVL
jgi:hypothetical protein